MKRLSVVVLLGIICISFIKKPIAAADELTFDTMIVSPAIIDAYPNQNYDITLKNNSSAAKQFKAFPSAFEINKDQRKVVPVENTNLNFNEYLKLDITDFNLSAKESKIIRVNFLKNASPYILGITFSETNSSTQEIGTSMQLASIFINRDLADEDFLKIQTKLDIKPKFALGSISFGKSYTVKSEVFNNTPNFLASSGEIRIASAGTKLSSISLTQDFPSNIYPLETFKIENEFLDKRTLLQRIGFLKFEQKILINGREIKAENQSLCIPFELIFSITFLSLIPILAYLYYKKIRSVKLQVSSQKRKKHIAKRSSSTISIGKSLS